MPSSKPPRRHSAPVMRGRAGTRTSPGLAPSSPSAGLPVLRLERPGTNLPFPISTFLGRQKEVAALAGLITSSRLITVTGAPGIGKSRLALEAAGRVADFFPDGARWINLSDAKEPSSLELAIADGLLLGNKGMKRLKGLREQLRGRRMLAVFDNCDPVAMECAEAVKKVLEASGHLTVLVTASRPLGIPGERVLRLGPLPAPPASKPKISSAARRKLLQYEPVAMLADRARDVDPDFGVGQSNMTAIWDISRQVDGIPLAIEAAAQNLSVMGPQELADHLQLCPEFVLGQPAARFSLKKALDKSFAKLDPAQALLLGRLSIFEGGWTLDAAQQVCAGETTHPDQVLPLLQALADNSLVELDRSGGELRYRLLSPIRTYARAKLDDAALAKLRTTHADWFAGFAEKAQAELRRGHYAKWLTRIDAEAGNMQAALDHGGDGGPETHLRIATALTSLWMARGELDRSREMLAAAIQVASDAQPALRARAFTAAGSFAAKRSDFEEALASAGEALRIVRDLADDALTAAALTLMGSVSAALQGPRGSLAILHEAFSKAKDAGDLVLMTDALVELGRVHVMAANHRAAGACLGETMDIARQQGDRRGQFEASMWLGWIEMDKGNFPEATRLFEQALRSAKAFGDRYREAEARCFLADTFRQTEDFHSARKHLNRAVALSKSIKAPFLQARSLAGLARLSEAEEDLPEARRLFQEVVDLTQSPGLAHIRVRALHGLAGAARDLDRARAKALLEEAADIARSSGDETGLAMSLFILGRHLKMEGDHERAAALHHEALQIRARSQDGAGLADSLEALAGMMAGSRKEAAGRLLGAATSIREARYDPSASCPCCQHDVEVVKRALPAAELEAALNEGAALSGEEAAEYASRGRGARGRPSIGWASLTPTELKIARLVAEGLSNPEIGERLFISKRTVGAHLARIFTKLDISSRTQLARKLVSQENKSPSQHSL